MKRISKSYLWKLIILATIVFSLSLLNPLFLWAKIREVKGIVFEDTNRNLKLDPNEKGIPGVLVSDQLNVVKTDSKGQYVLTIDDEEPTVIFITKPADYEVPIDKNNIPQFYYIHHPKGSPSEFKYKGIDPTGPIPESINFPLFRSTKKEVFEVLIFTDPQPRNETEIGYIRDDVIADILSREVIGPKTVCGVILGDLVFDNLALYDKLNEAFAQLPIPIYRVPGNHDTNYDAPNDKLASETYKRYFGPNYYSFDYGDVHFIALDDIEWHGKTDTSRGWYEGRIGEKQLTWLKNDLKYVPKDKLVVLLAHIPITSLTSSAPSRMLNDSEKLFEVIKDREHLLFLAGHEHVIGHYFLGEESCWRGKNKLHHMICAAVSGAWWLGPKDERGIPIADQQDGTPNGYQIFRFNKNKYSQRFIPASKPAEYQLRISSPNGKIKKEDLTTANIIVNVFNGNEFSAVECQVDNLVPMKMGKAIMEDPYLKDLYTRYKDEFRNLKSYVSAHIWTAPLPKDLDSGLHRIIVTTTDQYGNRYKACSFFEVE